jgi:regulator of RNase E activity RraA
MDQASEMLYRQLEPRFTNTTREKLGVLAIPRPTRTVIDKVLDLDAPTADCADILEELGIDGYGVPSTILKPVLPKSRIAGPAVTVLNEPGSSGRWPYEFTDIFLIAEPGDVVVIGGEGFAQAGS